MFTCSKQSGRTLTDEGVRISLSGMQSMIGIARRDIPPLPFKVTNFKHKKKTVLNKPSSLYCSVLDRFSVVTHEVQAERCPADSAGNVSQLRNVIRSVHGIIDLSAEINDEYQYQSQWYLTLLKACG